jgi:hypothetical protein
MSPHVETEIRETLSCYLSGEISLNTFQEIFLPKIWDIDQKENKIAEELAYEIMLRIAEYSNGDWDEQELKLLFRPLVENYKINITSSPQRDSTYCGTTVEITNRQHHRTELNLMINSTSTTIKKIRKISALFGSPSIEFAEAFG